MKSGIQNRSVLSIHLILSLCFLYYSATSFALNFKSLAPSAISDANVQLMFQRDIDTSGLLINNDEHIILSPNAPSSPTSSPYLDTSFVQPSRDNTINLDYQYEDQDINALLRLRIQEEAAAGRLNLENIIILAPLSDTAGELETQLQEENIRYRNSIIERERTPHERTVLIPLNLTQLSHWAGIAIRLNSYSDLISVNYIDSLGLSAPNTVTESLQRVYGCDINIENIPGLIQTDTTGCGPLMIENFIRLASGTPETAVVYPERIEEIRAHHVNLAQRNRPDLNFKKRQMHNVRSFKDIDGNILEVNEKQYKLCIQSGLNPNICGGGNDVPDSINNNQESSNETKDEQSTSSNWDLLPDELKLEIIQHLSSKELSQASLVSKNWYRLINDDVLWMHIIQNKFDTKTFKKALSLYDEIISKEKNFKIIFRICRLLSLYGSTETKLKLYRERGEIIEIDSEFSILDMKNLITNLTGAKSSIKILVINNLEISQEQISAIANALKKSNCKITDLDLENNQINYRGAGELAEALKNPNCKLKTFNLQYNNIGGMGVKAIAQALKSPNCKLTKLSLVHAGVGPGSATALAAALKDSNCKLTKLNLNDNSIELIGITSIAETLQNPNCCLTKLYLVHNWIDFHSIQIIAQSLKNPNCKLTHLDLENNKIGSAGTETLVEALKNPNCKLTSLRLGNNKIDQNSAITLASALRDPNCILTKIDLQENSINPAGAQAIAKSLKGENCKLAQLCLQGNNIGSDGTTAIAEALINTHCHLTTLQLFNNKITSVGAASLAKALKAPNCNISKLNLGWNNIGNDGTKALASAIENPNCILTEFYCQHNGIEHEGTAAISKALKNTSCQIVKFDIGANNIGSAGTAAIVSTLVNSQHLITQLNFQNCNLDSSSIIAIAEFLKNPGHKITRLNLGNNIIDLSGAIAIAEAVINPNCKLSELSFRKCNIDHEAIKILIDTLLNPNCKLIELDLGHVYVYPENILAIAEAIKNPNCKLTKLVLGCSRADTEGIEALANAMVFIENELPQHRKLEIVDFRNFKEALIVAKDIYLSKNREHGKRKDCVVQ